MPLEEPQIKPTPSFENLEFQVPKPATPDDPEIIRKETFNTTFNGVPVTLEVKSQSNLKEENQLYYANVRIIVSTKTSPKIADIDLAIRQDPAGMHKVSCDIINRDRNMKGLGRALWEMSLKLIQKFADEQNISITDEARRMPHMGLSEEKWNELFVPLFAKHGYVQRGPGVWEKVYVPGKG